MPFREKLKSLIHRHDDESSSAPSSSRQSRYETASQRQTPEQGQRPISGAEQPSQPSPARSRSKLRRSYDRKSNPAVGEPTRRSLDTKRKSLDQRQINSGVAPNVPDVPSTYKGENIARPVTSQDAQTKAAKENARKSSHVINFSHNDPAAQPLSSRTDKYSENNADWNIMNSEQPNPTHAPAPLRVNKTSTEKSRKVSSSSSSSSDQSSVPGLGQTAIARKPIGSESPRASRDGDAKRQTVSGAKQRQRLSMDKPLPTPPHQTALSEDPAFGRFLPQKDGNLLVKDAPVTPSLEGVVNLENTIDTDVTEHWAPAVIHETVQPEVHHIREEVITREIHNYDVYHRILPIIDIEVLPARHFVPTGNGDDLMEISADEIPGRTGYNQEWFVGEMLSKLPKDSGFSAAPRRFTAREFPGTEGDYKEYLRNGIPTTETTWVHPPTFDDTAMLAGQTQPFHFGSENPADDGLRIRAPNGKVVGSSRYHKLQMERQVEPVTPPTESMRNLSVGDYLEAVPSAEGTGQEALTPYGKRMR